MTNQKSSIAATQGTQFSERKVHILNQVILKEPSSNSGEFEFAGISFTQHKLKPQIHLSTLRNLNENLTFSFVSKMSKFVKFTLLRISPFCFQFPGASLRNNGFHSARVKSDTAGFPVPAQCACACARFDAVSAHLTHSSSFTLRGDAQVTPAAPALFQLFFPCIFFLRSAKDPRVFRRNAELCCERW